MWPTWYWLQRRELRCGVSMLNSTYSINFTNDALSNYKFIIIKLKYNYNYDYNMHTEELDLF